MVKVRETYPTTEEGKIDIDECLLHLQDVNPHLDKSLLLEVCQLAYAAQQRCDPESHAWVGISSFKTGLEMAQILAELKMDTQGIAAAILYRGVREGKLPLEQVCEQCGEGIAKLIEGVLRMAAISSVQKLTDGVVLGQNDDQKQNLRKMLVAMVDDVRVALIKLSERTCALRAVKKMDVKKQQKVAREIFDIYAPLAHRLGIGQLKWELEDLSFRYLEPKAYKRIAALLDEKRIERESYIKEVIGTLGRTLTGKNIRAELTGRAKHIYSIWRKMQRKKIDFYQVYDIRAVRVLVPTLADCYAALGLVHGLWQHIPKEFDDYIATPKENRYRSLHTAVLGPGSKILEVQIRTFEMHEEAELGVCAHWHYKEGTSSHLGSAYEYKIAWLRQVLEWQEELGDVGVSGIKDILSQIRQEIVEARIYVFTPDGHVVDMAVGATPIDFAYHIHTEVGHRCRGAKVNGRIVPLNYTLNTGEQVEILTAREGGPSRDWLNSNLGYIKTPRARAKIQHWFKLQNREYNIAYGKGIIEREFERLSLTEIDWLAVVKRLKMFTLEDVYAALGAGDLKLGQVLNTVQAIKDAQLEQAQSAHDLAEKAMALRPKRVARRRPVAHVPEIEVQGVGQLLTHIAGCCKPVPGDKVIGYISVGKGVSVHRQDCGEVRLLGEHYPNRMIEVSWQEEIDQVYPVKIFVRAYDRQGLLRDISAIFANARVNVVTVNTGSDEANQIALMELTIEVRSLSQLGNLLDKIQQLPSVFEVYRGS